MKTKKAIAHVSKEIADAFGMHNLPNTIVDLPSHTPTPWKIEKPEGRHVVHLVDMFYSKESDEQKIATTWSEGHEAEANAAFIVKAVNLHEDLVQALKATLMSITDDDVYERFKPLIVTVENAIAKAEGK